MNKTEYQVMRINDPVFANQPKTFAKSTSDAVKNVFGRYAVRSGDFTVDYCVTNLATGRKTYLKEIK